MMKIQKGQQLASKTSGVAYGNLGGELQQKLNNLTINQAIEKGLITSLGDADNNFFRKHETIEGVKYAVINGCEVTCSSSVANMKPEEVREILGDLKFTSGIVPEKDPQTGKPNPPERVGKSWFRLGLPGTRRTSTCEDVTLNEEAFA